MHLTGNRQKEQHYGVNMQDLHELTGEGILKSISFNESGDKILM